MIGEPEREGQETAEREPPKPRPVIVRVFRALKRYENRRRRRAKEYASQHPFYERMMAQWTRRVGLFTGALVLVGIITAAIFWRQLTVMQGQLDQMNIAATQTDNLIVASGRSATAAEKANEVANKAVISADRPWVGVDIIDSPTLRVGGNLQSRAHWRNTGRSPALHVIGNTNVTLVPPGEDPPTPMITLPAIATTNSALMPSAGMISLSGDQIIIPDQASFDAIKTGLWAVWFSGRVEYTDSTGASHFANFLGRFDPASNRYAMVNAEAN